MNTGAIRVFLVSSCFAALVGCASAPTPRVASPAARSVESNPEQQMEGASASDVKSAVTSARGLAVSSSSAGASMADDTLALGSSKLMRLHSLNIGAGSCHIVECPNSDDVLIYDCGQMHPSSSDLTPDQVAAYMDNVIDGDNPSVVLSHADTDHVSLISKVMKNRTPQTVWFGGALEEYKGSVATWLDDVPDGKVFFGWEPGWNEKGKPVPELKCGDADAFMLTVNIGKTTNSKSLMLMIKYKDFSAVFSGDAAGATEKSAMKNFPTLLQDVTVLFGSHHGARSHQSNHQAWADKAAPQIVVYSAGVSHGHPTTTAAERYRASLISTEPHAMWVSPLVEDEEERYDSEQAEYTTELGGTIVIETDGSEFDLKCSRQPNCF